MNQQRPIRKNPNSPLGFEYAQLAPDPQLRLRIQKRDGRLVSILYLDISYFDLETSRTSLILHHSWLKIIIEGTKLNELEEALSAHRVILIQEDPSSKGIGEQGIYISNITLQKRD